MSDFGVARERDLFGFGVRGIPRRSLVAFAALATLAAGYGFAQERPVVRNLRSGGDARLISHWIAYGLSEWSGQGDLNGDGDTGDQIVHVENLLTGEITNLGLQGGLTTATGDWLQVDTSSRTSHLYNVATGERRQLPVGVQAVRNSGPIFAFAVEEATVRTDLNGDNDRRDSVFHVYDIRSDQTTNLALAAPLGFEPPAVADGKVAFCVSERTQGADLDGNDTNLLDRVVHVHDTDSGVTRSLQINGREVVSEGLSADWLVFRSYSLGLQVHDFATRDTRAIGPDDRNWRRHGDFVAFDVEEEDEDLNGDGDLLDRVAHVHDLRSNETLNLRLSIGSRFWSNGVLLLSSTEGHQSADLNRDGDLRDDVIFAYVPESRELINIGFAVLLTQPESAIVHGQVIAFGVPEGDQGADLNGDDDSNDLVLHTYDLATGEARSLDLPILGGIRSMGDWLEFDFPESEAGDLNGDGATTLVACVHHLSSRSTRYSGESSLSRFEYRGPLTRDWLVLAPREGNLAIDLNGDGDTTDSVVHVHELATGRTTNLELAIEEPFLKDCQVNGGWLTVPVSERAQGADLDGAEQWTSLRILHLVNLDAIRTSVSFVRGDCDGNGEVNLTDAVCILEWLFLRGSAPECLEAADSTFEAEVRITSAVYVLNYLFLGGSPPKFPFPTCGRPEIQFLSCERASSACEG